MMKKQAESLPLEANVGEALSRAFRVSGDMPEAMAEWILGVEFDRSVRDRVDHLAHANQDGLLTEEELAELDAYARFECVIGTLKTKVRIALGQ